MPRKGTAGESRRRKATGPRLLRDGPPATKDPKTAELPKVAVLPAPRVSPWPGRGNGHRVHAVRRKENSYAVDMSPRREPLGPMLAMRPPSSKGGASRALRSPRPGSIRRKNAVRRQLQLAGPRSGVNSCTDLARRRHEELRLHLAGQPLLADQQSWPPALLARPNDPLRRVSQRLRHYLRYP